MVKSLIQLKNLIKNGFKDNLRINLRNVSVWSILSSMNISAWRISRKQRTNSSKREERLNGEMYVPLSCFNEGCANRYKK